jgi:hypothetical protein
MSARTVVFVESRRGVESLFTRLLRVGSAQCGWNHRVVTLRNEQCRRLQDSELARGICSGPVDLICFIMDAPLGWPGLWKSPQLRSIPKASFWYDDYMRSPETLAHPEVWKHWQKDDAVTVFSWDGHWRNKWREFSGHEALPVHLSADLEQFQNAADPLFPELRDHAVFTGTIPSVASLQTESNALPSPVRNYLNDCVADMELSPWPVRPYELAANERAALGDKRAMVINQWLSNPVHQALFNQQIWRWGKRTARLHGLSAILQSGPVAVLSGHHTERFATESELRVALQAPASFQFRNTTEVPAEKWSGLFRSGRFQVQFTDPQSVEGGLPFRVFECAASGVVLLSDHRKELGAEFRDNEEIVLAQDETGLTRRSAELFAADAEMLTSIGTAARVKFREKHTAAYRWNEIVSWLFNPSPSSSPSLPVAA